MAIVSQNAGKQCFFVISGRNSGKTYEVFTTFYAKQTQFPKSQMNVNLYNTTDYENKSNWTLGENKPNSNPIKANFRKAQMNVNSLITKDYRKNDAFAVPKNKANSNPIQTQSKPILEKQWLPGTKHPLEQSVEQETGIEVESCYEQKGEKNDDK